MRVSSAGIALLVLMFGTGCAPLLDTHPDLEQRIRVVEEAIAELDAAVPQEDERHEE